MNPIEQIRCTCLRRTVRPQPRRSIEESLKLVLAEAPDEKTREVIERVMELIRKREA